MLGALRYKSRVFVVFLFGKDFRGSKNLHVCGMFSIILVYVQLHYNFTALKTITQILSTKKTTNKKGLPIKKSFTEHRTKKYNC